MRKLELTKEATNVHLPLFLGFVDAICAQAGVGASRCGDIKLAVEEACCNVIMHGYRDASGDLTLSGERDGDRLVIAIEDHGAPFHPDEAPPPDLESDWQAREPGGLGWHLIRANTDELAYRTEGGSNRLELVFHIKEE